MTPLSSDIDRGVERVTVFLEPLTDTEVSKVRRKDMLTVEDLAAALLRSNEESVDEPGSSSGASSEKKVVWTPEGSEATSA